MTARENAAILLGVAFMIAVLGWLLVSHYRGKRRIPPRLVVEVDRLVEPGYAIPVNGDPRMIETKVAAERIVSLTPDAGPLRFDWPVAGAAPFDWARDLHTPDWSRRRV